MDGWMEWVEGTDMDVEGVRRVLWFVVCGKWLVHIPVFGV